MAPVSSSSASSPAPVMPVSKGTCTGSMKLSQFNHLLRVSERLSQAGQDGLFQFRRRQAPAISVSALLRHQPMRDVETVALAMVVGMGGGETIPGLVIEETCQQAGMGGIGAGGAVGAVVVSQLALHGVPEVLRDDAVVLPVVDICPCGRRGRCRPGWREAGRACRGRGRRHPRSCRWHRFGSCCGCPAGRGPPSGR
jgi:hypothetical protein